MTKDGNQAHVIVCGNEKGGSGKTTTTMHLAVAIMNAGYRVATLDLDTRQRSLTRYVTNRKASSEKLGLHLSLPTHSSLDPSKLDLVSDRDAADLSSLMQAVSKIERNHDFVLIDTPGHDGYLMQLCHCISDTLVTPMNDSYMDFDVLGQVDPKNGEIVKFSHYASTVRDARRKRLGADKGFLDWVVVRNRVSSINSRNGASMQRSLKSLSMKLGCRLADGIGERVVFRELFPMGFTVLDDLDEEVFGGALTNSHLAARHEVRSLIAALRLPIDELGKRRAEARKNWLEGAKKPTQPVGSLSDQLT
ncbi:MAG: division plane positioning ATPase MipZ [Pseudomonadota bacterium]